MVIKTIKRSKGVDLFNQGKVTAALTIFTDLGDEKLKKACYGKQYNQLAKKVANVKTLSDVKRNKYTYEKMLELARKLGDYRLEEGVRKMLSSL